MMQNTPIQKNLVSSNVVFFTIKSVGWTICSLLVLASVAAVILSIAVHTPGGKKIILCPIYDATVASLTHKSRNTSSLSMVSKEWRDSPQPSADWAYLPIEYADTQATGSKKKAVASNRTEPVGVVPVPVQNWSKHTVSGGGDVLLHLSSEIMEIKLERRTRISATVQMRRLREQIISDPIALLNPAKIGEIVYSWQSAVDSFRSVDQTAALRESFRVDLSQQCTPRASWKKILARLGMANEKTKPEIEITAAWRNVTPSSLTLVGHDVASGGASLMPAAAMNAPFGWSVIVVFNTDTSDKPSNSLTLTYSGLSEPMMHSVMKQIGLIRDTSLADRELPANFFRPAEESGSSPVAKREHQSPQL